MSWAGRFSLPATLRSLFRHREQAPSSPFPPIPKETVEWVGRHLEAWINGKGYRMADRTPHQAAERMGVAYPALHHYCLCHLGIDFRSLRTRLRIRDAQEQMRAEPETPTSAIARRVGYQDRSNFARHFKKMTGVTPDEWRKKNAGRRP